MSNTIHDDGRGPVCVECSKPLTPTEIQHQIPGCDELCDACDAKPENADAHTPGGDLGAFSAMMQDVGADTHTAPNGRAWRFFFEYPGFFTWSTRTSPTTCANINATPDWSEDGEIQIDRDDTTGATSEGLALVKYDRLTVRGYLAIVIPHLDVEADRLGPEVLW